MHGLRAVRRALPRGLHHDEAIVVSAPTYDLGKLHGGLRLQGHKQRVHDSADSGGARPIATGPPDRATRRRAGPAGRWGWRPRPQGTTDRRTGRRARRPCARIIVGHGRGDRTLASIHDAHGDKAPCIVIECDGKDAAVPNSAIHRLPVTSSGRSVADAFLMAALSDSAAQYFRQHRN